jgi:cytochrome c-type biogenesis protein CcmE
MLLNKTRAKRLIQVSLILGTMALAAGLILFALRNQVNLYLTPKQLTNHPMPLKQPFRLGGLVKKDSLHYHQGTKLTFIMYQGPRQPFAVTVDYQGPLPALFKEGKGAIAEGYLTKKNHFHAQRILAKHDESYQPPGIHPHAS